ncbi:MAG: NAD(P)/FAD-dependent oxidoreductase [Thermotogota bacterium]|nr:NAD(P)/FAD-dependent oxidoreductase [Thermotogota bacterium]
MGEPLKRLQKKMFGQYGQWVVCSQKGSSILLEGSLAQKNTPHSTPTKDIFQNKKADVLIIGGGVIGCTIARELARWDIDICLLEKESDLAMHASSRNDGMIHPGLAPSPGSLKAKYNAKGNAMYETLSKTLDFEYKRVGSLLLFDNRWLSLAYPILSARASKNGVESIEFLSGSHLKTCLKSRPQLALNPSLDTKWGVHIPSTGIVSPYKTSIAFCENAVENGVNLYLNTQVLSFEKEDDTIISCQTTQGSIRAKIIINCAGTFSDEIAEMAGDRFFTIHPRKGTMLMMDKKKGHLTDIVLSMPKLLGESDTKGGGIVPTVEGNLLVGPDAVEHPFKEDYSTTRESVDEVAEKHLRLLEGVGKRDTITYFAGTRASTYLEDFIIQWSSSVHNLYHVAGIQSPGLASAPAIALDVAKDIIERLQEKMPVKEKVNWQPKRKGIPRLAQMSLDERAELIKENPDYGEIICRCEEISKGEIIDALHSPIRVDTVDGIKRRVRAGMGRCQGGFCKPLVMASMEEELEMDPLEITKKGEDSEILKKNMNKEILEVIGETVGSDHHGL